MGGPAALLTLIYSRARSSPARRWEPTLPFAFVPRYGRTDFRRSYGKTKRANITQRSCPDVTGHFSTRSIVNRRRKPNFPYSSDGAVLNRAPRVHSGHRRWSLLSSLDTIPASRWWACWVFRMLPLNNLIDQIRFFAVVSILRGCKNVESPGRLPSEP